MIEHELQNDISVRILIRGRVQGVGFRQSARRQACTLGLEAKAMNKDDGSVLLETSGPRDAVEQFIAWSKQGPRHAVVDDVMVINTVRLIRGII